MTKFIFLDLTIHGANLYIEAKDKHLKEKIIKNLLPVKTRPPKEFENIFGKGFNS